MKTKVFSVAVIAMLAFSSCEKDFTTEEDQNPSAMRTARSDFDRLFVNRIATGKRLFSEALVTSLNQSVLLRKAIKDAALKEFDNETDVLFLQIKDTRVESGTVGDLIARNIEGGKAKLEEILSGNPTLTIFVPQLPDRSFSAGVWDVNGDVPAVAIRLGITNDVPLIWSTGEEEVIPAEYTPGFPVLVVKDNERVLASTDPSFKDLTTNTVLTYNGVGIKFTDELFDVSVAPQSYAYRLTRTVDPKISTAYTLYQGVDGWQRDYIYYGIHQGTPNGPMSYDFQERIGLFSMDGNASTAYNVIADQTGDAYVNQTREGGDWGYWTDGQFDFNVKVLINSSAGAGTEFKKRFAVRPEDLFELTYTRHSRRFLFWTRTWYTLQSMANKATYINIPVVTWNIQDKSSEFKVSFEEIDLPTTTTYTDTHSSKFATNFEITGGQSQKIGFKFGASGESTQTHTISKTLTQGSDDLGDEIINFGDKVIIGQLNFPFFGSIWNIRDYSTGMVRFSFEPKRVQ